MQIEITSRRAGLLCAVGLALTLSGGVAWAQGLVTPQASSPQASSPQAAGVIAACAKVGTGALRLSTPALGCSKGEKLVSWNQAGPAGPAGPAGAPGQPGISGYEVVQWGSAFGQSPSTTASCPSGKKVIGGGFDTELAGSPGRRVAMFTSASIPQSGNTQWYVDASPIPGVRGKVQVYAICAVVAG